MYEGIARVGDQFHLGADIVRNFARSLGGSETSLCRQFVGGTVEPVAIGLPGLKFVHNVTPVARDVIGSLERVIRWAKRGSVIVVLQTQ